jgi:hypothetical protein
VIVLHITHEAWLKKLNPIHSEQRYDESVRGQLKQVFDTLSKVKLYFKHFVQLVKLFNAPQ